MTDIQFRVPNLAAVPILLDDLGLEEEPGRLKRGVDVDIIESMPIWPQLKDKDGKIIQTALTHTAVHVNIRLTRAAKESDTVDVVDEIDQSKVRAYMKIDGTVKDYSGVSVPTTVASKPTGPELIWPMPSVRKRVWA